MPRDILAHPELLPFLTPVQRTVKIIPGDEIHVQTLFVEEWAAHTVNQTLITPKSDRILDIRVMQRSGARARIKGEVFLPVFTEHAEEKVAERCADTLDGQAQERHRMPMPRIGPVPDPRGNFPFSKKAGAD